MKAEKEYTGYSIAVDVESFKKILDKDLEGTKTPLYQTIDMVHGVRNTDYDGHFGPNVYFELCYEYDTSGTIEVIYKLIREYMW